MPKKGYKQTEVHKKKLSDKKKSKNNPQYGKAGVNATFYGRHHTDKTKKMLSDKNKGKNNPNWKGDDVENLSITQIHKRVRKLKPLPANGKCEKCNKVADYKGRTKLSLANIKNHVYTLKPDDYIYT